MFCAENKNMLWLTNLKDKINFSSTPNLLLERLFSQNIYWELYFMKILL